MDAITMPVPGGGGGGGSGGGGGELVQMSFTDMMEEAVSTAAVAQIDKGKGPDDWGSDFDSDSHDENAADRVWTWR